MTAEERPNILVILVDDMGYSDLGCYGSEIATPHLDKLAANGIRYTQMYNTAKCFPTRVALLTGNYFQHSDRDFSKTATAGEVLRPVGYRTWWSGKHHADFNPITRGFDHFSGFLGGACNFWNPGGEDKDGKLLPGAVYTWAFDEKEVKPFIPDAPFHCTDAFTDWALAWMDEEKGGESPWFLYLAYNAPHWPLHAHPEDIAKFEGVYDGGYPAIREARYRRQLEMGLFEETNAKLSPAENGSAEVWEKLTEKEKKEESLRMAIHAAMVHQVDRNVGRLVAKITEKGELENTLILFLSDNGASSERPDKPHKDPAAEWGTVASFEAIGKGWANASGTPMRKSKGSSFEGGINTPMIAHWPAGITARGSFYREPCHLIDLLPTWMEIAGASHPGDSKEADIPAVEGISLVPTFAGEKIERETPLFFEWGSGNAVRDGKWKLVRLHSRKNWELYDLVADRSETVNLAEEYPERVEEMSAAWHAWFERCTGEPYTGKVSRKK
ncbi:MAG: arylsulfatase [Verrucomicrobiota bacterium]